MADSQRHRTEAANENERVCAAILLPVRSRPKLKFSVSLAQQVPHCFRWCSFWELVPPTCGFQGEAARNTRSHLKLWQESRRARGEPSALFWQKLLFMWEGPTTKAKAFAGGLSAAKFRCEMDTCFRRCPSSYAPLANPQGFQVHRPVPVVFIRAAKDCRPV